MPVLPSHVPEVKQYYLPSTADLPQEQQAWVKIDMSPSYVGDLLLYQDSDNMDAKFIKWLVSRISEWNFTEPDGKPVPINFNTILRMDKRDFHYLFEQHFKKIFEKKPQGLDSTEKKS